MAMDLVQNSYFQRRRSPSDEKSAGQNQTVAATKPDVKESKELVMEKIRILKRGENLSPNLSPSLSKGSRSVTLEKEEDVIFCSADRLGSNPEVVRERISFREKTRSVEDWAGFVLTPPPPSSVPIPLWIMKKKPDAASVALDLGDFGFQVSSLKMLI
uniref:Uncharacterized protein n=1 Tax=Kalanchoe fedtschenkoi TaxID=63787 RepID=A0A7N0T198_KALFE